jgi:adenosylmethionine-8-amino-7-oxononanoate aminotransferase
MSHLVHRNLRADPPLAASCQGIWLTGADGQRVMDGSGAAAVACLDHALVAPRILPPPRRSV